ncbi:hypothetical protein PA598K_05997 [Paenibacillus sp. 598K]|nr:hypothetical protein PA598K_05997 [Paenibacillus sp. 598K]
MFLCCGSGGAYVDRAWHGMACERNLSIVILLKTSDWSDERNMSVLILSDHPRKGRFGKE